MKYLCEVESTDTLDSTIKRLLARIKRFGFHIFERPPRRCLPLNGEISPAFVPLSQENSAPLLRGGVDNSSILDNGLEDGMQAYPILRQQIRGGELAEIMERSGMVKRHERRERPNHGDGPLGSSLEFIVESLLENARFRTKWGKKFVVAQICI